MITKEKLDELWKNKELTVVFNRSEFTYEIQLKNDDNLHPIVAVVFEDLSVEYFVTDVYNCGCDYAQIDLDKFNKLREIVEGK